MGRVFRRTVGFVLVAAVVAGCSAPAPRSSPPPVVSASAAPATTPPPSVRPGRAPAGDFAVQVRKLSLSRGADRPLPTTVWVPRGDGPFPLIVFSHGLGGTPGAYADLLSAWAEAGFVVAAPAFPHTSAGAARFNVLDVLNQPADATYVITRVLAELRGRVDSGRVAAAGHSAGGVTTLGMFTGSRDERLDAGVVLAGRQIVPTPFTGPAAPLFFVHGRQDATVTYAEGRAAYDATPWPKAFLTVTEGGHVATGTTLDVVARTTTDFWRWSLYGDRSAKGRLGADAKRGGLATLTDQL
jgi:dienelactone hydrolase